MNKDFGNMEELEYGVRLTMPLLTQEEINKINIDIDEITRQFTKMVIKDKDLAIAQHIIGKQEEMLEQKQSILDKVTDKLKEYLKAIKRDGIYGYDKEINEILNIIEGEKK